MKELHDYGLSFEIIPARPLTVLINLMFRTKELIMSYVIAIWLMAIYDSIILKPGAIYM